MINKARAKKIGVLLYVTGLLVIAVIAILGSQVWEANPQLKPVILGVWVVSILAVIAGFLLFKRK
jgi:hypothetical protein